MRISEPHVHAPECYFDHGTPEHPNLVLACGEYDAAELARILGPKCKPPVTEVRAAISPTPSYRLRDHSREFEFGYGGSGPAQLALAILLDCLGDADRARRHYQDFKWRHVALWKGDSVEITAAQILAFLEEEEANTAAFDARRATSPASASGKAVL